MSPDLVFTFNDFSPIINRGQKATVQVDVSLVDVGWDPENEAPGLTPARSAPGSRLSSRLWAPASAILYPHANSMTRSGSHSILPLYNFVTSIGFLYFVW